MHLFKLFMLVLLMCSFNINDIGIKTKVYLQPFTGISNTNAVNVLKQIQTVYPNSELLPTIDLPQRAYYKPRNRYRAEILIQDLALTMKGNNIVIGLTDKDISTTRGKIYDYGVMGMGYEPGKSCIVSEFRTKNNTELFKVTVHELGHTFGLPHCKDSACYMEGYGGSLTQEIGFCKKCKTYLKNKGWKL